jgi:hypothetical protein
MNEINATVISLPVRSDEAYDRAADRVNMLMDGWTLRFHEWRELHQQFIDDNLRVRSGPRRGRRLTKQGRRRRLDRLLKLEVEMSSMLEEETALRHRADAYFSLPRR